MILWLCAAGAAPLPDTVPVDVGPGTWPELAFDWPTWGHATEAKTFSVEPQFAWLDLVSTVPDAAVENRIANLVFHYEDGQTHPVTLRLGKHLTPLLQPTTVSHGFPAWINPDAAFTVSSIANPRPQAAVTHLQIRPISDTPWWVFALRTRDAPATDFPGFSPRSEVGPIVPHQAVPPPFPARTHPPIAPIRLRDGHLTDQNGRRKRLWGVNLTKTGNFPEDPHALAASLAAFGFNVVRLHHADHPSTGLVQDGVLQPKRLAQFDALITALNEEGIYVILEGVVSRTFTTEDGVSPPIEGIPNGHKLVSMFEPSWNEALLTWLDVWLNRNHSQTQQPLASMPGVALVELSNEHSLVAHWLTGGLDALPRPHLAKLDALWNQWLGDKYPDDGSLRAAWGDDRMPGETLGAITRHPTHKLAFRQHHAQRVLDLHQFYAELETQFYQQLANQVRSMGYEAPLVGSITTGVNAVAANQAPFGVTDMHAQVDRLRQGQQHGTSILENGVFNQWVRQPIAGQAVMVSEVNHPYPGPYRAEGPLFWATMARVQDWDAVIWFHWDDGQDRLGMDLFDISRDPVKWAQMPAAGRLFVDSQLPAATGAWFDVQVGPKQHLFGAKAPLSQDPAFLLAHQIRRAFSGPTHPRPGEPVQGVGWWNDPGRLVIDQPWLQAVVGHTTPTGTGVGPRWAPGLSTDLDRWAVASLMSSTDMLGNGPALLTVVADAQNQGLMIDSTETQVAALGAGAVELLPPKGTVDFVWPRRPRVFPIGPAGQQQAPLRPKRVGPDTWRLALEAQSPRWWWIIE